MSNTNIPLWVREFGSSYQVPSLIAQHPRLADNSWHNDICPSFIWKGADPNEATIRIWAEHIDPEMREMGEKAPRFVIAHDDGDGESLGETADPGAALQIFFTALALDLLKRAYAFIHDDGPKADEYPHILAREIAAFLADYKAPEGPRLSVSEWKDWRA